MTKIFAGRYTAQTDAPFVVFLIGMRINRLRAIRKWLPVASAMGPMISTLMQHPEKGLLHAETFVRWREIVMVQYWRSYEQLEAFARNRDDPHLPAWQAFSKAVGGDGSVGIWHETYQVHPGQHEAIYGNMPRFGLAAAAAHLTVSEARATSRERMQAAGARELP